VHFYTTGHLTAVTALKSLDAEFEAVSASLKVPFYKTFWRVTLPICTPALVDIARYFFINAMTTISAVVFLYAPETKVASIAILNLDEAGEMGAAAAMAVLIAASPTPLATLPVHGAGACSAAAPRPGPEPAPPLRAHPMDRDRILLTPGPLTTTLRTKLAMLQRLGQLGRRLQRRHRRRAHRLLDIVHGQDTHVSVPLQGSGTFSVEAAVATVVPRDGHVLVPDNGAYCKRAAKLSQMMGRKATLMPVAEHARSRPPSARRSWPPTRHHPRGPDPLRNRHRRREPAGPMAACASAWQGPDRRRDEQLRRAAHRRAHGALRRAGGRQRQVPGRRARHGLRVHPQGRAGRLRRQQPEPGDGPARPAPVHGARPASGASPRPRTWWRRWPRPSPSSSRKAASRRGWRATPTTAARWSTAWRRWASGPS
jgi:hypothetical protein